MESNWFNVFGVAGIGGVALASVVYIFREIIRKQIFPTLSEDRAYTLLIRIILFIFILGVLGIFAYSLPILLNWQSGRTGNLTNANNVATSSPISTNNSKNNINTTSNAAISNGNNTANPIATTPFPSPEIRNNNVQVVNIPTPTPVTSEVMGTVLDEDGKRLMGVKVEIEDFPNLPPVQTNSDGMFRLRNIPKRSGEDIRIRVFKDGYGEISRDVVIGSRPRKIYLEKIK